MWPAGVFDELARAQDFIGKVAQSIHWLLPASAAGPPARTGDHDVLTDGVLLAPRELLRYLFGRQARRMSRSLRTGLVVRARQMMSAVVGTAPGTVRDMTTTV
jgi:hypothetical protein